MCFIIKHTMTQPMRYTPHASERCKQRNINKKAINVEDIKTLPIYTRENGCVKYLDIHNLLVYYVRQDKIVTMIATNPIQMLRYYAISKNINFNRLCRDNAFHNCTRGKECRYIHL